MSTMRMVGRHRAGISLMEVLFSLGIAAVGLLGVAILLPASAKLSADGRTAEDGARAGLSWVREFKVRGYAQTGAWVVADASNSAAYVDDIPSNTPRYARAFCVDPRFAAIHGDSMFPYIAGAAQSMKRISLRSRNGGARMTQEQSEEVFVSNDDLTIERPKDVTLPARQTFVLDAASNSLKRNSEGRISWFATLVPQLHDAQRDTYLLSVVVVADRDPAMATSSRSPEPDNERVAAVANFWSGGIGGGDVQLQSNAGRPREDLKLKPGDWVMLSANKREYFPQEPFNDANGDGVWTSGETFFDLNTNGSWDGGPVVSTVPTHRWYRVISGETPPAGATAPFVADVTLHGPDWDLPSIVGATQATIVTGAVAVYERTITLEHSSLWTE